MYRHNVNIFVNWCKTNYLELNVDKTKELIVDFRKNKTEHQPLIIENKPVQVVDKYKYLGTVLDNKLCLDQNVDCIYKKCNSRLFFLRKLYKLKVDVKIF